MFAQMTKESLKKSIEKHFGQIPDPRVTSRSAHKLIDIITIAILGILCRADGWVAIETYEKAKEEWLSFIYSTPDTAPVAFISLKIAELRHCSYFSRIMGVFYGESANS